VSVETESAGLRRGALPRLPWILLALSLALNAFFVGGFFWVRGEVARAQLRPAERFELIGRELNLDAKQRAAFDHFIGQMRMRARHLREANQPLIEEAWNELEKPKPDDGVVDRNLDAANANRHNFQIDNSHALRTFLTSLSDEQRRSFVEFAKHRQNRDVPPILRQLQP
jgi:uncharacterized membrane protein